jgi:NAD(P)-dependent dehydrogenase (short-subunit alcohol dehydrogenase family)
VGVEGRTALVTGAARGIGRVIAKVLAEAGGRVALADRDVAVSRTAEELRVPRASGRDGGQDSWRSDAPSRESP